MMKLSQINDLLNLVGLVVESDDPVWISVTTI